MRRPTPSRDDYPISVPLQVRWGEMDAFRHVNNTVYFRWFEDARIAYFRAIGFVEHMEKTGVGPILAFTSCRFRRPLAYPDAVDARARVVSLGDDRFVMDYAIWSASSGELAASGEGRIVVYDYRAATKAPVPPAIREAILRLEPRTPDDTRA